MGNSRKITWIERMAAAVGLVPRSRSLPTPERHFDGRLAAYPPFEKWDQWEELGATREPRRYALVPTTCFNCEAGCGLLAYVDPDREEIVKLEGNPLHPGSRGSQLRQGAGDDQPALGPGTDPPSPEAEGSPRLRRVGRGDLGRRAG